ncbi:hypothetical protein [Roseateles saccharophilus]|uniref:Uncharacterized protein n=1 Tax=Roseateles saccharophilus TaxID=304 RepID=A0A4R3U813_ROSSA|nr:hypothetical protein [Roseateles saccharophilus]MDG0836088.1 hypothetical protein [Roseateles saccharophilus]TCU81953.1 hypothetical protein EV671_10695 [Roseateles saccharophilus]
MNIPSVTQFRPSTPPLCRSYVAIFFNHISVQFSPAVGVFGAQAEPMLRAVGALSDSLPDYLGAWPCSGPKRPRWLAIVDGLRTRGVERIRYLVGPDCRSKR